MEWISVKDRLPNGSMKPYICCLKNRSVMEVFYSEIHSHGWFSVSNKDGWQDDNPVTHWMPLPDPPKSRIVKGDREG